MKRKLINKNMGEFNIVNLNNFSWMINVAIIGAVFSVFSLIYNDYYIYYGFITVVYGIVAHVIFKLIHSKIKEDSSHGWLSAVSNTLVTAIWIIVLVNAY